jgi:hypothetical protein
VTPGFQRAVEECGFELGPNMPALSANQQRNVATVGSGPRWTCAAPKLIGALDGHKPETIVEQLYRPQHSVIATYQWVDRRGTSREKMSNAAFPRPGNENITVRYRHTDEDGTTTFEEETFGSGDTVPSCDRCKVNLPEMLCHVDEICP